MSVALDDHGRNRADARNHQQHVAALRDILGRRAIAEDAFEYVALRRVKRRFERYEMPVLRSNGGYGGSGLLEGLGELLEAEVRQGVAAAQRQEVGHFKKTWRVVKNELYPHHLTPARGHVSDEVTRLRVARLGIASVSGSLYRHFVGDALSPSLRKAEREFAVACKLQLINRRRIRCHWKIPRTRLTTLSARLRGRGKG